MAGDSEQTLQNHQQPNGGEPFLIGVSGGTASGKVQRGPGARSLPLPSGPLPGPGPAAAHVAGGRGLCQLLQPPRGPRASAPGSAPVLRPPCADYGRRCGGRAGGDSGHPRFQRYPGYRSQGWHGPRAAVTRGRGPVGEGQRKRMLIVLQVRRGGEGFKQGPLRTPGTPVFPCPGVDALAQRRSPAAKGGASRVALSGRLRESTRQRPGEEEEPRLDWMPGPGIALENSMDRGAR